MARMNLIDYMNHWGFDCLDMSRIILALKQTDGTIYSITDNPMRVTL